jgi:hypothetical protein
MALPAFLAKIVSWLRAGYPDGVPERDYIPLFALLGSQLTDDEVKLIADELAFSSDPDSAERSGKQLALSKALRSATPTSPGSARTSQRAAGRWRRRTGTDR